MPGIDAEADDYVTKPFEPLDLVDRVGAFPRQLGSASGRVMTATISSTISSIVRSDVDRAKLVGIDEPRLRRRPFVTPCQREG